MRALLLASLLLACLSGSAQDSVFEEREFANPSQEHRYRSLVSQLRCLVCQNQAISDSNADLAAQLRDQVYDRISKGETDQQILDFMTDRYGDYVLFNPPVKQATLILWVGPFVLLLGALAFLFHQIRKRRGESIDEDDSAPE